MYRRVNGEALVLLGGPRALLMQLAMPGVAAGVDEHSDFRRRPLARLWRTLSLSYSLALGPAEEARRAAAAINRAHRGVAGPGYSARDPRLLLWVDATLVDSALAAYSAFVRPLSRAEREAYWRASRELAPLLGIPPGALPRTYGGFRAYVDGVVREELRVDARARELGARVLRPLGWVPGAGYAPLVEITSALLPASLRRAYGLPPPGAWWRLAAWGLPRLRRMGPRMLWEVPAARGGAGAGGRWPEVDRDARRMTARIWKLRGGRDELVRSQGTPSQAP
jgi:uncharacterized protein (DUF2236 family)